jgi:hypothetical protein
MDFLVPNCDFWWWQRSGSLSGKNAKPPIFSGQRVYVGGRRGRGDAWGGHTTPWHGLALLAPLGGVWPLWPLSISYSGSVCLLVKFEFCSIFWDFSWKSDFCTKTRHQGNSAKNNVSPC